MDARFQVCFTPPSAVLFAFPSRYLFAIGHHVVFSLGEWSPRIRTGFHVSRPTWDPRRPGDGFRVRGFHPLRPGLPASSPTDSSAMSGSRNPGGQALRFGLLRFRSPLLTQSLLLSSPSGTEMFHFPECRSIGTIDSSQGDALLEASGFPIRIPPGRSLLTARRGLSQSSASFIASWCQGIHRAPVYA